MKRFQMITEADARVLDYGSTVTLVAGGHVTPLAPDTLAARRLSVVREGGDVDAASPPMISGPTRVIRSTIPTWPPPWRGRWREARPTRESSTTAPDSGRRLP